MKPFVTFLSIVTIYVFAITTPVIVQAQDSLKNAKIYFLRSTGFIGSLAGFNVFIDSAFVCRLNEKKYSVHQVLAGPHTCSVRFGGKKLRDGIEKVELDVEAGKSYYVQIIFRNGFFTNKVSCEEITANTAKRFLPKLKEDDCVAKETPPEEPVKE